LPQRKNQIRVRLECVDAKLLERAMCGKAREHEAREEPPATAGHRLCSHVGQAKLAGDADKVRLAPGRARTLGEVASRRGRKQRAPGVLRGTSGPIYRSNREAEHEIQITLARLGPCGAGRTR